MVLYIGENHLPYSVGIVDYYVDYRLDLDYSNTQLYNSLNVAHAFEIQDDKLVYHKFVDGIEFGIPLIMERESPVIYFATLKHGKYPISLVRYNFGYTKESTIQPIIDSLNTHTHESLLINDIDLEVHEIRFDSENTIAVYHRYRYNDLSDTDDKLQYMYIYRIDYNNMWRGYLNWPSHIETPNLRINDKVVKIFDNLDDAYDNIKSKDTTVYTVVDIIPETNVISAYVVDNGDITGIGCEDDFIGLYKKVE